MLGKICMCEIVFCFFFLYCFTGCLSFSANIRVTFVVIALFVYQTLKCWQLFALNPINVPFYFLWHPIAAYLWDYLKINWYNLNMSWYNLKRIWYNLKLNRYNLKFIWYNLTMSWYNLKRIWYNLNFIWYNLKTIWYNLNFF